MFAKYWCKEITKPAIFEGGFEEALALDSII